MNRLFFILATPTPVLAITRALHFFSYLPLFYLVLTDSALRLTQEPTSALDLNNSRFSMMWTVGPNGEFYTRPTQSLTYICRCKGVDGLDTLNTRSHLKVFANTTLLYKNSCFFLFSLNLFLFSSPNTQTLPAASSPLRSYT
jgi:hypothetical protein